MPDFFPQNDTFFPGPQIAPVGISDPTFSSRLDLWHVPTLRTFLLYKCFFLFGTSGSRGSGLTCGQKRQIPGKFSRDSGEISPRFRGNFPGHSREISRGIFEGKMIECAYLFNAPHAVMMVHTATPVLHVVRTRFLAPCHGRQPAESGGHFP